MMIRKNDSSFATPGTPIGARKVISPCPTIISIPKKTWPTTSGPSARPRKDNQIVLDENFRLILVRRMSYCSAKSTLLAVILIASPWVGLANDPSYHDEITAITKRYRTLANRKALGGILSPAEEKERQCLLG